jgi:SSS family solute:Na+ symporter
LLIGRFKPDHSKPDFRSSGQEGVDLTPWKHFKTVSIIATLLMIATYVLLSPLGLAETDQPKDVNIGYILIGLVIAFAVLGIPLLRRKRT